jgi:thymidylate synthase
MDYVMQVITARNVNSAWDQAKAVLNSCHIVRPSRVGEVWEYPAPVVTEYFNPTERILFNGERNANPIFHFMEGLWMLAGRNDVEWISQFNPRMRGYSDDGKTFHGAYGHRWRKAFDMDGGAEDDYADQLPKIVRMLKKSQEERRAVVSMWNPIWDLERPELLDVPCNTTIYFKIRDGVLTMTVCCRSNDIAWGAYGANAVHMSMMMEYVAAMIGVQVGTYWHLSDSWHAYTERWESLGGKSRLPSLDLYEDGDVAPYAMVDSSDIGRESWDEELQEWMDTETVRNPHNSFFPNVATPLMLAWRAYKEDDLITALQYTAECKASDLAFATASWLKRIQRKREMREKESK